MLTLFGAAAVTFMVLMYSLESRHPGFVLAFACGCALSSAYGFLAGTWPFGVVEAICTAIAVRRWLRVRATVGESPGLRPSRVNLVRGRGRFRAGRERGAP